MPKFQKLNKNIRALVKSFNPITRLSNFQQKNQGRIEFKKKN